MPWPTSDSFSEYVFPMNLTETRSCLVNMTFLWENLPFTRSESRSLFLFPESPPLYSWTFLSRQDFPFSSSHLLPYEYPDLLLFSSSLPITPVSEIPTIVRFPSSRFSSPLPFFKTNHSRPRDSYYVSPSLPSSTSPSLPFFFHPSYFLSFTFINLTNFLAIPHPLHHTTTHHKVRASLTSHISFRSSLSSLSSSPRLSQPHPRLTFLSVLD